MPGFMLPRAATFDAPTQSRDNNNRSRIVEVLRREGSECVSQIARSLGLSRTTVEHHIRVLRRLGVVKRLETSHWRAPLYVLRIGQGISVGPFAEPALASIVGNSQPRRATAKMLLQSHMVHVEDLRLHLQQEGLELSRTAVLYHLSALHAAGFVQRSRFRGRVFYAWSRTIQLRGQPDANGALPSPTMVIPC